MTLGVYVVKCLWGIPFHENQLQFVFELFEYYKHSLFYPAFLTWLIIS